MFVYRSLVRPVNFMLPDGQLYMQRKHILHQKRKFPGGGFLVTEPFISFSYDCPACGRAVGGGCSAFSLDGFNCVCTCGDSMIKSSLYGSKISILYPCRYCGLSHTAVIRICDLISLEFISLICPENSIECCTVAFSDRGEFEIRSDELAEYICDILRDLIGRDDPL